MRTSVNVAVRVGIRVLTGAFILVAVRVSIHTFVRVAGRVAVDITTDNSYNMLKLSGRRAKFSSRPKFCKLQP